MLAEFRRRLAGPWTDIQDHLQFLHQVARSYPHAAVIELGVRSGESTAAFLSAAAFVDGHVWSCDIDPPQVPEQWLANPRWVFVQADSVSPVALAALPEQADVVFIDTSHDYGQTLAELAAYVPRVKPGGVVLLHDTQWMPPAISFPEPTGPVTDALNEYCDRNGLTWENRRSASPGGYGLGIIRI